MVRQTRQIDIARPRSEVWATIADLESIADWNPQVIAARLTSTEPLGLDATRSCDLAPRGHVDEAVTVFEPESRFVIEIVESHGMPGFRGGGAEITLFDGPEEHTTATISMYYNVGLGPLGGLIDRLAMRRMTRKVLVGMTAGLKHFVETGEAVTPETEISLGLVRS